MSKPESRTPRAVRPPSGEVVTRFAPSPTGRLHLGHAYSALFAEHEARRGGGRFLLRIEDIDPGRCRDEFTDGILEDLAWLGVRWEGGVVRQSRRMPRYAEALDALRRRGLLYPCFCTRRGIEREIAAAGGAPHGAAGATYPGICRALDAAERGRRIEAGESHAWRLDMAGAIAAAGTLDWADVEKGSQVARPELLGDVVLARKEVATSYHLAVTVDDADQGVTVVTRGADLWESTDVHRLLQALLDLPVPLWHHHRLLSGPDGRRFAKRDRSVTIAALRRGGASAEAVRRMAGWGKDAG